MQRHQEGRLSLAHAPALLMGNTVPSTVDKFPQYGHLVASSSASTARNRHFNNAQRRAPSEKNLHAILDTPRCQCLNPVLNTLRL